MLTCSSSPKVSTDASVLSTTTSPFEAEYAEEEIRYGRKNAVKTGRTDRESIQDVAILKIITRFA